ncbi:endonuclease domain-containing protein [Auraticoccus cholistanensis]|uniref:endonuclease domain-containing protein n=1 Tax=Auraticoccus cholistanensis TaxID=2656650 RepID=UPI0018D22551
MRANHDEIFSLLSRQQGVLLRRDCPELGGSLDWLARRGALTQLLPGTYALSAAAEDPVVRMRAARRWAPDGVLRGAAAARVTYWPTAPVGDVAFSVRTRQVRRDGYRLDRRHVPPDLVAEDARWRVTVPALTVLDLCEELGGEAVDTALRLRATTVGQLHDALAAVPRRPGNRLRARLLLDSRSEPWSAAERLAHRLLHEAGIGGWRANHRIVVAGQDYYADVAFPARRLLLEADGRAFHGPERFEEDRARHNELTLAGWTVLHVTWTMLQQPGLLVTLVEQALRTCTR